jgi:hypothetical protein
LNSSGIELLVAWYTFYAAMGLHLQDMLGLRLLHELQVGNERRSLMEMAVVHFRSDAIASVGCACICGITGAILSATANGNLKGMNHSWGILLFIMSIFLMPQALLLLHLEHAIDLYMPRGRIVRLINRNIAVACLICTSPIIAVLIDRRLDTRLRENTTGFLCWCLLLMFFCLHALLRIVLLMLFKREQVSQRRLSVTCDQLQEALVASEEVPSDNESEEPPNPEHPQNLLALPAAVDGDDRGYLPKSGAHSALGDAFSTRGCSNESPSSTLVLTARLSSSTTRGATLSCCSMAGEEVANLPVDPGTAFVGQVRAEIASRLGLAVQKLLLVAPSGRLVPSEDSALLRDALL